MKVVGISSNTAWSLYNFRSGLIRALLERNYRVVALAPEDEFCERLASLGCEVVYLPMDKKGTHPLRDLGTLKNYRSLYRRLRVDVALHYTIKPVIYGSLAARSLGIPYINTITGLGTAFIRDTWLTRVVESLYRVSQRWPEKVFFLNQDDLGLFLKRRLVRLRIAEYLPGEGIDLARFRDSPLPEGNAPVFLLIARMLWDKGVGEFVAAVRRVRQRYPDARFQLLGFIGVENQTAIPKNTVESWVQEGVVEYLGSTDDVRSFIEAADCVVLPSYREGTPRSLLEAAAMGRPIITTDVVGCREVVDDGINGLLCHPRDAVDLAEKMERMITLSPQVRAEMGRRGRDKVEREFDEQTVIQRYLTVIETALRA